MKFLRALQFWVIDARGRSRALPWPVGFKLKRLGVPRPFLLYWRTLGWQWLTASFAVPAAAYLLHIAAWSLLLTFVYEPALAATPSRPTSSPSSVWLAAIMAAEFGFIVFALLAITPRLNRGASRRYSAGMIARRRCPWCAYDLSGAPPPSNPVLRAAAQTTCPECGGIWALRTTDP